MPRCTRMCAWVLSTRKNGEARTCSAARVPKGRRARGGRGTGRAGPPSACERRPGPLATGAAAVEGRRARAQRASARATTGDRAARRRRGRKRSLPRAPGKARTGTERTWGDGSRAAALCSTAVHAGRHRGPGHADRGGPQAARPAAEWDSQAGPRRRRQQPDDEQEHKRSKESPDNAAGDVRPDSCGRLPGGPAAAQNPPESKQQPAAPHRHSGQAGVQRGEVPG